MDKYQASSSCPKPPSHMPGKERLKRRKSKGKKGYCPQRSRCHCGFVMVMSCLLNIDRKVDAVLAKEKKNEEMIRDLRGSSADIRQKVVKRGRSVPNNHYKFQGPMSIAGLQICGDGVNCLNLWGTAEKEGERHGNFTNLQHVWKTSPSPNEKNQASVNTSWTDCGLGSSTRASKMNDDNCHDSFRFVDHEDVLHGQHDRGTVCSNVTQGYQHDQIRHGTIHENLGDSVAGWDVFKQEMSDIDDGGKISGLSDLPGTSDSDLIYACSSRDASDDSSLTSILHSSFGQGSAQKTYPGDSLESLKELTFSDNEVNPKAAEEVGVPEKETSLTVSSRHGSDRVSKAGVEASSDSRSDVGLGIQTTSSTRSENTESLQGKVCPTLSDPLLAVPQAINHTGNDRPLSSKANLHAENLSQCQNGFVVSHQQTDNGLQWSENSLPSILLDCEQTGNDIKRAPERSQTTQCSDCMQTANEQRKCERSVPCGVPSTVEAECGNQQLHTHVSATPSHLAEAGGCTEGVKNIAFRDRFKGVIDLKETKEADHVIFSFSAKAGNSSPEEYINIPLPVSEAGDGSKDFKESHSKAGNDATKCKQLMSAGESPSKVNDTGMKESEPLTPISDSVGSAQTTEGPDGMKRCLSARCLNGSLTGLEKLESGTPFSAMASGPAGQGNIRNSLLPPGIPLTASCMDSGNSAKGMALMPSHVLSDENDM